MSALREKSLLFGALVASTIAVGLLLNNQNAASFSVQPATQVQVSVVPEVVNPTLVCVGVPSLGTISPLFIAHKC